MLATLLAGSTAVAEEANLDDIAGILDLVSSCRASTIKLEADLPEGIVWEGPMEEILFGRLSLATSARDVLIDQSTGAPILYVDEDGTGEFAEYAWERALSTGDRLASVRFEVNRSEGVSAEYHAFLLWSPYAPTALKICRDEYRAGSIVLDDEVFRIAIIDDDSDGWYDDLESGTLLVDVDQDGRWLAASDSHEVFRLDEAFDIEGTDYRVTAVAPDGSRIAVDLTDEDVAPKLPLLVGYSAPVFETVALDGSSVALDALAGRFVLLDFWAGWCGPCVNELPTIRAIDRDFAAAGVVVVGINMDRSPGACADAVSSNDLTYAQVFDGPDGPVSTLYRIDGIPMTYVLDREGVIRARGLRGASLYDAIVGLLAEDGGEEETEGDAG